MKRQKLRLNRIAILLVLLSAASLPANAADICSREGKSKMLKANVTKEQIAIICPATTNLGQQNLDKIKESNLARIPIGLYVQKVGADGAYAGMTNTNITVRNNSGKFIDSLYIEVLTYDDENRVGNKIQLFNSVNVGETMASQTPINTGGRPWNDWKYTYNIR